MNNRQDPACALLTLDEAVAYRQQLKQEGKTLTVTNGCFDLIHRGHASYLHEAAALGDELLVLINSDASVRELKGNLRPLISEKDRAYMLGALASVDKVVIFNSQRCDRELDAIAPDIYTKAGDYTLEKLDPVERAVLEKHHTKIVFMPFVQGFSTTGIVEKIKLANQE
ncbi:MAG: adenylyltransferase/cytidyltransferase family protein [Lentisphaeria bacterium]|nr:adenylyltransferase/cytidyltransferase family protein [Lentisphaeria bacterium]